MTTKLNGPQRPVDLQDVPQRRFWGERKPPKNRADMFSSRVVNAAGDGDTGGGSVATLRMYGPIDSWGGWWGISAQEVSEALDAFGADVTEIRVRINSPGGEAWEGLAILNMLRAHKARVVAVVDGIAASAASYIAAGCDETVMSPGTQLMIHDASSISWGQAADLRKDADVLDSLSNSIASLYAESAGGTDAAWRALMIEETWYTAAEAVTAKLADRIGVVADAGETSTAGEPDLPEIDDVEDAFDLSIFNFAGRSHAPAPAVSNRTQRPPAASAGGSNPTKEGATLVDFTDEQIATLREQVGFPEDADADTITAAVIEALSEHADDTTTNTAAQVPEGMQLIETSTLTDLTNRATAGQAARDQQLAEHRDRVIAQAIKDGKTTKARQQHWQQAWAADPEGTEQLLTKLAPGIVPVEERGHADDAPANTDVRESAGYKNWSL